jgi:hypothetical protein
MGFKDAFIKKDGDAKKKKQAPSKKAAEDQGTGVSFPDDSDVIPIIPDTDVKLPSGGIPSDILKNFEDEYEKFFNSIDKAGFDFHEFMKLVRKSGGTSSAYEMALEMANQMDEGVTKETLLEDAAFYIGQIEGVHEENANTGNNKLQKIQSDKVNEEEELTRKKESLKEQIEKLQGELNEVQGALSSTDTKYGVEMTDTKQTMAANTKAKDKLIRKIQNIVDGINTNL